TEARALLLAQHTNLYAGLLRTYLALNDSAKAFATVERARARSLVELLAERRLDFRADAPADLLKQQDELDRQRSAAYAALVNLDPRKKDDERIKAEQAKLVSLERQQRDLTADIKRASPRIGILLYPDPLDLKGAQAALDSGTLLLAYYADEKQTYLFAVTKDSQKVFTLPVGSAELTKQVRRFRNAVAVPRLGLGASHDFEVAHEQGQKLYDTLVRPAQEWVDKAQRVLICPDEASRTLPFAALVSQTKPQPRYFIEDKPLHTIASTTVYAETRKWASSSNSKREMKLLAFGDALYTKEQAEAAKGQKPEQAAQKP